MIGLRGPRFWHDGGVIRFVNHLDSSTRDGPREATEADKVAHPEAFAKLGADADGIGVPMVAFKEPAKRRG
jgi:hypothetical protein